MSLDLSAVLSDNCYYQWLNYWIQCIRWLQSLLIVTTFKGLGILTQTTKCVCSSFISSSLPSNTTTPSPHTQALHQQTKANHLTYTSLDTSDSACAPTYSCSRYLLQLASILNRDWQVSSRHNDSLHAKLRLQSLFTAAVIKHTTLWLDRLQCLCFLSC